MSMEAGLHVPLTVDRTGLTRMPCWSQGSIELLCNIVLHTITLYILSTLFLHLHMVAHHTPIHPCTDGPIVAHFCGPCNPLTEYR